MHAVYLNINMLIAVFTAGMVQILVSLTETWSCNLKKLKLLCRWLCLCCVVLPKIQTWHKNNSPTCAFTIYSQYSVCNSTLKHSTLEWHAGLHDSSLPGPLPSCSTASVPKWTCTALKTSLKVCTLSYSGIIRMKL